MMKVLCLVAFSVFGLSIASAKTYEIKLDNACKAGTTELKAGTYHVALDASKVKFTDENTGQTVETSAKVMTADKKYPNTSVATKNVNGTVEISEIDLGGTKTRIELQ